MAPTRRRTSGRPRKSGRQSGEPLAEYRRKRDFDRTREPSGGTANKRKGDLQFIVQKHAASSLHYDLRLELDGVMRSWAVPKGPSLDPAVKRLAMQVEDHPMEYNTFEGTIPKGEYGGGTVMLWDRGTYWPDEPRKGEDASSAVRRGLKSGKLSFTFHGERLQGSFALVRTDTGEKPKWLLIKHRDDDASDVADITEEVQTSVASGRTMEEIAAENERVWRSNRDGQAGGEQKGKQEAERAPMIAPMRPKPARTLPAEGDWTYEPWRGGERVLAYVTAETALLMNERGGDVTKKHGSIAEELVSLADRVGRPFVIDGELAEVTAKGAARNARSKREGPSLAFYASDLLLDGDNVRIGEAWKDRRAALETLLRRRRLKQIALQRIDSDSDTVLRRAAREKWPGILARRSEAPYDPGKRSDALRRVTIR